MEKVEAKKLVESLGKVVTAIARIDKNKDGKIQLNEIFDVVQVLAVEVFNIYGDVEEGLIQLQNADSSDRHLLIAAFAEKFELENEEAEELIESIIFFLHDGFELFLKIQGYFRK
jgi:Ca2+-binding EF-hand superfamily protein